MFPKSMGGERVKGLKLSRYSMNGVSIELLLDMVSFNQLQDIAPFITLMLVI